MSMTREEATELLRYRRNLISSVDMDWCANETEALDLALSALHPVSREQVEKRSVRIAVGYLRPDPIRSFVRSAGSVGFPRHRAREQKESD